MEYPEIGARIDVTNIIHRAHSGIWADVLIYGGDEGSANPGGGHVKVEVMQPYDPLKSFAAYEEEFRREAIRTLLRVAKFMSDTTIAIELERERRRLGGD